MRQGDPARAARAARKAVALFECADGRQHPDVASALLVLGRARKLADAWTEAQANYTHAAAILRRYSRLRNPDIRRLRIKAERALCCCERVRGLYARTGLLSESSQRHWATTGGSQSTSQRPAPAFPIHAPANNPSAGPQYRPHSQPAADPLGATGDVFLRARWTRTPRRAAA